MRRARSVATAGTTVLVVALAACAGGVEPPQPWSSHLTARTEYRPGVTASVFRPAALGSAAPVVVLVPGGGWVSADPSGLTPLADALAAQGAFVVSAEYRVGGPDSRYPVPVGDVVCATAFAVAQAHAAGAADGPVVLAGHSAGAQLAALAALRPAAHHGDCPHPVAAPDGFVGLAGAYDIAAIPELAEPLFGALPDEAPEQWREATPATWAAQRPDLAALLVHGEADDQVPVAMTQDLAAALQRAGHTVTVRTVPEADHQRVYAADVAGPLIRSWLPTVSR